MTSISKQILKHAGPNSILKIMPNDFNIIFLWKVSCFGKTYGLVQDRLHSLPTPQAHGDVVRECWSNSIYGNLCSVKRVVIGKPHCLPREQAKLQCSIWDDCINWFILLNKLDDFDRTKGDLAHLIWCASKVPKPQIPCYKVLHQTVQRDCHKHKWLFTFSDARIKVMAYIYTNDSQGLYLNSFPDA